MAARLKFIYPVFLRSGRGDSVIQRKVLADKASVTGQEFFNASSDRAIGIKPKLCMRLRSFDYRGEKLCEYAGVIYSVYRTFDRQDGITELYLSPKAGEQNGKTAGKQ